MLPHRVQEYKKQQADACNSNLPRHDSFQSMDSFQQCVKTASYDKTRNGMKWSETELEQLINEAHEMKTIQEIAELHTELQQQQQQISELKQLVKQQLNYSQLLLKLSISLIVLSSSLILLNFIH